MDAGKFQIANTSNSAIKVKFVVIDASNPSVLTKLILDGGGRQVTITSPGVDNRFSFNPDIEIAPGGVTTFSLQAALGKSSGTSSTPTPPPGSTPSPTATTAPFAAFVSSGRGPSEPSLPNGGPDGREERGREVGFGIALVGLLALAARWGGTPWPRLAALALVLIGVGAYVGCGGEESSEQTISRVSAAVGNAPATVTGVPASIGSVSRPANFDLSRK